MNTQQILVVLGSILIFSGSIGAWQQTTLALLYLAANVVIFIFLR